MHASVASIPPSIHRGLMNPRYEIGTRYAVIDSHEKLIISISNILRSYPLGQAVDKRVLHTRSRYVTSSAVRLRRIPAF
jgi:hypothetical protein